MSNHSLSPSRARVVGAAVVVGLALFAVACGDSIVTNTLPGSDQLTFNGPTIHSLDSTAQVIVAANPGNATLKSLADSTLLVFTAGVQAKRVNVSTNLTSAPLYFVGIHRTINRATGAFSTWTLVGLDDPSHLTNIVEVSGFAQSATGPAPTTLSGVIGDGSVNGRLLQVATGGAVSEWDASTGSATFTSDAPGAACPGFTPTANITCAMEVMHVRFTMSGSSGGTAKSATQTDVVDVPTMRLTYTP